MSLELLSPQCPVASRPHVLVAVLAVIALVVAKALGSRRTERRRLEAAQHREQAQTTELEADMQSAEADERAARARREQLAAEQQKLEAEQRRGEAAELHAKADALDPQTGDDGVADGTAQERDTAR